jgi:hypothetical protein
MPKKTLAGAKRSVEKYFGKNAFIDFRRYLHQKKPSLWGEHQGRSYLEDTLVLVLFHDIWGLGWDRLLRDVDVGKKFNHKTLQHNAKVLRGVGEKWGRKKTQLGSYESWVAAMRNIKPLPPSLSHSEALLYQDSVDFPLERKKGRGPQSDSWSAKLRKPGRRFQILRNASGRIIKAWGGYSPKLMDSMFIEVKKKWLNKHLKGATVVADNHYSVAQKLIPKVEYFVPTEKQDVESKKKNNRLRKTLTKKQQKRSQQISSVRARVEHPFAWITQHFAWLNKPFAEEPEQLDALVWMAIGAYNVHKN